MSSKIRLLVIVGPTAVGKTEIAFELAKELGGEVVSADSASIYREMSIGVDKPTDELIREVRHHMVGVFSVTERVTVQRFQEMARAAVRQISASGKVPILCGGSGLYVRSVIDDLRFPPESPDLEVRERLIAEAAEVGYEALYQRLRAADPIFAARISPADHKRVIRGLEILEVSGLPPSSFYTGWGRTYDEYELFYYGLDRSDEDLEKRIETRIEEMIDRGLLEETRMLVDAGMIECRPVVQSIGYSEAYSYLRGELSLLDMKNLIKKNTTNLVRKQRKWFRADRRITWIFLNGTSTQEVIRRIVVEFRGGLNEVL